MLVPFGILNLENDALSVYMGQSAETSDFIVDCLEWWWQDNLEWSHLRFGLSGSAMGKSYDLESDRASDPSGRWHL